MFPTAQTHSPKPNSTTYKTAQIVSKTHTFYDIVIFNKEHKLKNTKQRNETVRNFLHFYI